MPATSYLFKECEGKCKKCLRCCHVPFVSLAFPWYVVFKSLLSVNCSFRQGQREPPKGSETMRKKQCAMEKWMTGFVWHEVEFFIESIEIQRRSPPSLYVGDIMNSVCHAEDGSSDCSNRHMVVSFWLTIVH